MNIALVAETAPAKTLIPIISKLDADILSLTHSEGAMKLLSPYSNEIESIGEGRRNNSKKRSNLTIARLVLQDTHRTYKALKDRYIDLLLTCGNAGDVRKGILAAKRLDIPRLHMEQDVYNPIEMIAYADLITVPNQHAKKKLKKMYDITNTVNIKGYPQAEYVSKQKLINPNKLYEHYGTYDFYILFLGGDTNPEDIPEIINQVQKLDKDIIIVPYRFEIDFIRQYITRPRVFIVKGHVDLVSLMNASQGIIYCAGMGVTIESGALSVPAVKIQGFHTKHASNDLARTLGINVVSVYDIPYAVDHMRAPYGKLLIKNGCKASMRAAELTSQMNLFDQTQGGRNSLKKIWNQRKKYR